MEIGTVLDTGDALILVVGETRGGRLLVDLTKSVEVSEHALANARGTEITLAEALKKLGPCASTTI